MSKLTNYGENKLADYMRGEGITLPTNWEIRPGSAFTDAGITEITGIGIAPATVPRSLVKWKSTQDDSLVSSGTSKTTSNTDAISFGTPTGSATMTCIGFFDGSGNCWITSDVTETAIVAGSPDPVELVAGALRLKLGRLPGATYYLVNKLIDLIFRAQAFTWPTTLGLSYFTTAPTDAGGGTEASGGGYARIALVPDLLTISSTQGNTSASSGSGGEIHNLAELAHANPSGDQGDAVATGVHDATSAGNLLFWKVLDAPISVVAAGPAPTYAPGDWSITIA